MKLSRDTKQYKSCLGEEAVIGAVPSLEHRLSSRRQRLEPECGGHIELEGKGGGKPGKKGSVEEELWDDRVADNNNEACVGVSEAKDIRGRFQKGTLLFILLMIGEFGQLLHLYRKKRK
ncbi:hypothetical protein PoB_004952000 [Plakobranchus ocellatus]|uniref:Uncharacterized protein n=1 Tax=Plakobranchus ocellatus TaxID=259542 RepID=A0AAV4BUN0_9GAST|nr:hypothetical protein PoB_004952000 [Plakobranchus ocellatus]